MPDYGVWVQRDLDLDATAADVDREALLDAQQVTLASHNADINRLSRIFGEFTTFNQASVRTGPGNVRLQPLDEHGRPRPIKGRAVYYVGFPIWFAGTAEGYTFWTRERMTVRDFADSFNLMLAADITWVRDQLLSPIFYDGAGFSFSDEAQNESVTVYGLANGDSSPVYDITGAAAAADDHYSGQANALGAGADNPMDAIYTELIEHPVNAGSRVVAFINTAQRAAMEALAGFSPSRENRDIIQVVPAAGSATVEPIPAPALGLPLASTMEYIGMHGSTHVVVWAHAPSGYMVTVAVDSVKPIAIRQFPEASLQGLINQGEPMARFPYQQTNYVRAMGTGAKNRVGAHVHKFSDATYDPPTGYTVFPLA